MSKIAELNARLWNELYPQGTRVRYWPLLGEGDGKASRTRSEAWVVCGSAVVMVDGYAGGIALTHIEVEND